MCVYIRALIYVRDKSPLVKANARYGLLNQSPEEAKWGNIQREEGS